MTTDGTQSPTEVLTADDVEFLQRPLYGFFAVAAGPQPPQPRPVWFEVTPDGDLQLFTAPDAVKVRQINRDSRVSLVVAAPVGEPERWVSVAGRATLHHDGAGDLLQRLAERYWDLDDPVRARHLRDMSGQDWLRVVVHPDRVSRYAM